MKKLFVLMICALSMSWAQDEWGGSFQQALFWDSLGTLVPRQGKTVSFRAPSSGVAGYLARNATAPQSGSVSLTVPTDTFRLQAVEIDTNWTVNNKFRIKPFSTYDGPFQLAVNNTPNSYGETRGNTVYRLGYNVSAGGGLVTSGESGLSIAMETFYRNSAADTVMEFNVSYYNSAGTEYRPLSGMFYRNTSGAYKDYRILSFNANEIAFGPTAGALDIFRVRPVDKQVVTNDAVMLFTNKSGPNAWSVIQGTSGSNVGGMDTLGVMYATSYNGVVMANGSIASVTDINMESGSVYKSKGNAYFRSLGTSNGVYIADNSLAAIGLGTQNESATARVTLRGSNTRLNLIELNRWGTAGGAGVNVAKIDSLGNATFAKLAISALNTAPVGPAATGTAGEIRFTTDSIFVCTATNTWKAVGINALSSGVAGHLTRSAGTVSLTVPTDTLAVPVVSVGGGTAILKVVSASSVYNCGEIAAGVDSTFSIACTGAVAGNPVSIGVSVAAEAGLIITAECTSNDVVTVRISNHFLVSAVDPASRTYKVMVTNF